METHDRTWRKEMTQSAGEAVTSCEREINSNVRKLDIQGRVLLRRDNPDRISLEFPERMRRSEPISYRATNSIINNNNNNIKTINKHRRIVNISSSYLALPDFPVASSHLLVTV
jgi:hypothetical protein